MTFVLKNNALDIKSLQINYRKLYFTDMVLKVEEICGLKIDLNPDLKRLNYQDFLNFIL